MFPGCLTHFTKNGTDVLFWVATSRKNKTVAGTEYKRQFSGLTVYLLIKFCPFIPVLRFSHTSQKLTLILLRQPFFHATDLSSKSL